MTELPYRIILVDDHRSWREAVEQVLSAEGGYDVRGGFGDIDSFLTAFAPEECDLVIMDINLPGASGIEGVIRIKEISAGTDVIMCTSFDDDDRVFSSLQAGACGYLLKRSSLDDILSAVEQVRLGGAPMTPSIARRILTSLHRPSLQVEETALTKREQEILDMLGEGRSYKHIAATLCLSLSTIQSYVKTIYGKLQIHSRSEITHRKKWTMDN